MKCPQCQTNEAQVDPTYGVIPCTDCQLDVKPPKEVEFTTQEIQDGRREYRKDTLQPRRDGVVSREYIEQYGTAGINATKQEIANAKYVWKDVKGWQNRDKSRGGRKTAWRDKSGVNNFRKGML